MIRDSEGAAAVEFALIAPLFIALMMQTFNLGQLAYGKAMLGGAVEQAARASSLETADTSTADAMVRSVVVRILPGATITSSRKNYYDLADIGRAEKWNDANADGQCNNGESYTDENGNGSWDADAGKSGNGGAGDTVIYTVTAVYDPLFKIPFAPGTWQRTTLKATAVKRNQPFAKQAAWGSTARTCP